MTTLGAGVDGESTQKIESNGSNINGEGNESSLHLSFTVSSKIAWLQEIGLTLTIIVIVLTTFLVIGFSLNAKAYWLDILIRASVSIIILGLVGWIVNWVLGRYLVDVKYSELNEANQSLEEGDRKKIELQG